MKYVENLIKLLNLSEDDVLRAILSVYSPCQPGSIHAAWKNRKDYGPAPSAKELWKIYEKYDFRCVKCGSQYRISFDHIDNNKKNGSVDNLQVLCQTCNRGKQKRGIKNKDKSIKIFKSIIQLSQTNQIFNTNTIHNHAGIGRTGGSSYTLAKFLIHRFNQS